MPKPESRQVVSIEAVILEVVNSPSNRLPPTSSSTGPKPTQYRLDLKTGHLTYEDGPANPQQQQPRPPPSSSTPIPSAHGFNANNDDFIRKLIDAVRNQPCLYNPNHENYGNKHSSSQYRASVWQRLCDELEFPDGPQQLQLQWKRIRDRYVRERKKRKALGNHDVSISDGQSSSESPTNANMSTAARHYEAMRWIDEFLVDNPSNSSTSVGPPINNNSNSLQPQQPQPQTEIYYMAPPDNVHRRDGSNSNTHKPLMHSRLTFQPQPSQMIRTSQNSDFLSAVPPNTGVRIKDGSTNGSPGSTTSEISVGSTAFNTTQPQVVMSQHQHNAESNIERRLMYNTNKMSLQQGPSDDSHLIAVPGPSSSQIVKKDPHERQPEQVMTMIIDPNHVYQQHQPSQKMYRLVNVGGTSEVDLNGHPMAHQQILGSPPRKKKVVGAGTLLPPTSSHHLPQRQLQPPPQLGDEILIDELGETIVIEQGDRMMLDQGHLVNGGDQMLVHHNAVQQQHVVQQTHIQPQGGMHSNSSHMSHPQQPHMRQIIPITQNRPGDHHYIVAAPSQPAYDPEAALINTIVSHLANLNEDEKVVTKMNIQRILMDARFGRGACVRMFREEEMNEMASMDQVQQQQQQQQHHPQQRQHVQNQLGPPGSSTGARR